MKLIIAVFTVSLALSSQVAFADGPRNFLQGYTEVHGASFDDQASSKDEDRSTASVKQSKSVDQAAPAKEDDSSGSSSLFRDSDFGTHSHRL